MMISGLTVLSPPDFVRTIANRHTASKGPNTIPSDALLLGLYHSTCGIRVMVAHRTNSYNRWVVSDQSRIAQDGEKRQGHSEAGVCIVSLPKSRCGMGGALWLFSL